MSDLQQILGQALRTRSGGPTTTEDVAPGQQEFFGPEQAEPTVEEVAEQLQAVMQEMDVTNDPQQLEQLSQVAQQLQDLLEQLSGGAPPDAEFGGGF